MLARPVLTPQQASFANRLFAKQTQFLRSVSDPQQLPNLIHPEIAFVGRSNVGKSSLINRLCNNNKLVKTSSKPGHTRALNFFNLANQLTLVDMPGYGFNSRVEWGDLILDYLEQREQLKRLFVLLDPVAGCKRWDEQLLDILDDKSVPYQIIFTKRDRLSDANYATAEADLRQYLSTRAKPYPFDILAAGKRRKAKSKGKSDEDTEHDITHVRWTVLEAAGITPSQ